MQLDRTTVTPTTEPALELVRFIRDRIPLARAMALELAAHDENHLCLRTPLAPNVNDKGCAFGGSLASLMTLAGWGLVELALRARGEVCDVYVGESTVRYLQPVWADFSAEARLAAGADWERFFATLATRGKARTDVYCEVPGADGKPAATLGARFVAKRRD